MTKTYLLVNDRLFTIKEGVEPQGAIERLKEKGKDVKKVKKPPTVNTMEKWMSDGIAKATDGCAIEPDGVCCHGHKSWLLVLGLI